MSSILNMDQLKLEIEKIIRDDIEKAIDSVIEDAKKQLENDIRKDIGGIVSRVANFFDYRQNDRRICITVDFKEQQCSEK